MRKTSTKTVHFDGGLWLQWSPVNQAWFVRWVDREVLRIFNSKTDAMDYCNDLLMEDMHVNG